eukprot:392417_1
MIDTEEALIYDSMQYPLLCYEKEDFGLEFDAISPPGQGDRGSQLPIATPSKTCHFMTPYCMTLSPPSTIFLQYIRIIHNYLPPILLDVARSIAVSDISSTQEKGEVMIMTINILAPLVRI